MKWKILPHFPLSYFLSSLDESVQGSPPIKQPLHLSQPWLERGVKTDIARQFICVVLFSLHNWRIRHIPRRIRRLEVLRSDARALLRVCCRWVQIQAFSDTKYVLFLFTFVWHWRCYEVSFHKGLSKYLHISALIYLAHLMHMSFRRLKHNFIIWKLNLKKINPP